jgi:hypothetical protein
METDDRDTLETVEEVQDILERSPRILTLSGSPGVWVGCIGLAGVFFGYKLLHMPAGRFIGLQNEASTNYFDPFTNRFIALAIFTFVVAVVGALYLTRKKILAAGKTLWSHASRILLLQLFLPLVAGGTFSIAFIYYGYPLLVAPICLAFYGMALIGAGRQTLSDIRYLRMVELMLGCTNLFFPEYGLFFWGLGFGALHVLYGAMMWNKYA